MRLSGSVGTSISHSRVKDLGFSWKKARKLLARADPIARFVFLQQLEPLLQQADQGRVLLAYIDEAHIHCDCDLGYTWGVRGEPALVHSRSPGLSYKATFYGIYLLPLARVHIWPKAPELLKEVWVKLATEWADWRRQGRSWR